MEGQDLVTRVTCDAPYDWDEGHWTLEHGYQKPTAPPKHFVVAYDFGIKRSILDQLVAAGCQVEVVPASTPAADVLAREPDGVFLSNGPGDPAVTSYGIAAVLGLIGKVPIFGICLGSQLLGLALGGRTYKMAFGHRGVNQPVRDLATGIVEITSHNHGFAVDPDSWPREGNRVQTTAGPADLTHWNLNDGTLEGLRCLDVPAFGVQYHPEAAPGPHDSRYLFDDFRTLIEGAA
jgi:carbamoyl-phosphate synthase small subunit